MNLYDSYPLVMTNSLLSLRTGKIHHAMNVGINPLFNDWAIFNSFLYVYQRVWISYGIVME